MRKLITPFSVDTKTICVSAKVFDIVDCLRKNPLVFIEVYEGVNINFPHTPILRSQFDELISKDIIHFVSVAEQNDPGTAELYLLTEKGKTITIIDDTVYRPLVIGKELKDIVEKMRFHGVRGTGEELKIRAVRAPGKEIVYSVGHSSITRVLFDTLLTYQLIKPIDDTAVYELTEYGRSVVLIERQEVTEIKQDNKAVGISDNEMLERLTKELMGYTSFQGKTCDNCLHMEYTDDYGYRCTFPRILVFSVMPNGTCNKFEAKQKKK